MSFKITYSVTAENMIEIDKSFDDAALKLKSAGQKIFPSYIGNKEIQPEGYIDNLNPSDTRIIISKHGKLPLQKLDEVMTLADSTQKIWAKTPWQERIKLVRKASENIRARRFEFSAIMSMEVGKTRLEALGEVEEAADLLEYYSSQMEKADGFVTQMGSLSPGEKAIAILKPYGVFAVIQPFNFPMALAAGAIAGAVVSGNTAVFKSAAATPWTGQNLFEAFRDSGLPEGVVQYIQGPGKDLGKKLVDHPLTKGIAFTGSYEVGMDLIRNFSVGGRWIKPCFVEMGGKNPGIVCKSADVDKAVVATWKSAFGLSGQKCSELSRIFVHESIAEEFKKKLIDAVSKFVIGNPIQKEVFVGPVIDERAAEKYKWAVSEATKNGGKILFGGTDIKQGRNDLTNGHFVAPTIVEVPHDHVLTKTELFLPFLNFYTFKDLAEAITRANDIDFGLTAGIFSKDESELEYFFDHIEAGVTYANRSTGITTGAWPGVNSFCGWKGSGGSGKGFCGPYYVSQFMREQSQTRHPY
jgi:1-pyrroline-5-carboxylate dehydrogenase